MMADVVFWIGLTFMVLGFSATSGLLTWLVNFRRKPELDALPGIPPELDPYRTAAEAMLKDEVTVGGDVFDDKLAVNALSTALRERDRFKQALEAIVAVERNDVDRQIALAALGRRR